MERIGWIGTGVMGKSMCLHVLKKGYAVSVHNQTKEKTDDLCRQGAAWFDTPGDVAAQSDIVFTMVGVPVSCVDGGSGWADRTVSAGGYALRRARIKARTISSTLP